MKHKIGDVVITSGDFYDGYGVVVKVVRVDGRRVYAEDRDGKAFEGFRTSYFPRDEFNDLDWDKIDWDHPWLRQKVVPKLSKDGLIKKITEDLYEGDITDNSTLTAMFESLVEMLDEGSVEKFAEEFGYK